VTAGGDADRPVDTHEGGRVERHHRRRR
jgi:hypothetical protein